MFERMADSTRHVLVLAQQEARVIGHGHIGTEHLLLALVSDPVVGPVLATFGVALGPLREEAKRTLAPPAGPQASPPFTPKAKKVLELSLREVLGRGGGAIEPGDLLLGILAEGTGVATQLLAGQDVDLAALRQRVLERLDGEPGPDVGSQRAGVSFSMGAEGVPSARLGSRAIGWGPGDVCALCGRDTWEVRHVVTDGRTTVCQICVDDAASAIRAAGVEEHRVPLPPRLFGTVPEPDAPRAIADAVTQVMGPEPDGGWGPYLEDATELRPYVIEARRRRGIAGARGMVRRIRFDSDDFARIALTVHPGPSMGGFPFEGPVKRIDGTWKMSRELAVTMLAAGGVRVPPDA